MKISLQVPSTSIHFQRGLEIWKPRWSRWPWKGNSVFRCLSLVFFWNQPNEGRWVFGSSSSIKSPWKHGRWSEGWMDESNMKANVHLCVTCNYCLIFLYCCMFLLKQRKHTLLIRPVLRLFRFECVWPDEGRCQGMGSALVHQRWRNSHRRGPSMWRRSGYWKIEILQREVRCVIGIWLVAVFFRWFFQSQRGWSFMISS